MTDIGSGVLLNASTTGSGTGNYESFLRLGANDDESGINTDTNGLLDNKAGIFTHSLQVGDLQVVEDPVTHLLYYEIRLDLDEVQSGDSPNITLEDLRFFTSSAPADGGDLPPSFGDLNQVFDMSGTQALIDTNHGSGTDDYVIFIPVTLLGNDPAAYFTLYAKFSGSDDGFEEFRALATEFTPQPDIGINKETNGTDDTCPNILVGQPVTWTYTVTNNGNLPLSNIVVTDDGGNGVFGDGDDFNPTYVSGDTNLDGKLDTTETWIYSATLLGGAVAGEYNNIAKVEGAWSFGQDSGTVDNNETDCYFGADPKLEILKMTNGIDNDCPVLAVGEGVTWTYDVTNSGNISFAAADFTVTDDGGNGVFGDGDDFNPNPILAGGFNTGDTNHDNILDPGETWHYTYTGTVVAGHYENIGKVDAGTFYDDVGNSIEVNATETDCYTGVEGCVRTPGFWQNMNNGGQFWDQLPNNEKHAGEDHFPTGELLYKVDSDGDGDVDGSDSNTFGLLIGDYNRNGFADNLGLDGLPGTSDDVQEDVLYISYSDARALINASNKQLNGDGKFMLGRDMVATWLNYLSGAGIGDASDNNSPHHYLDDAIDWMQKYSGMNNVTNGTDLWDQFKLAGIIKTNLPIWNNPQSGIDLSASQLHSGLDGYNNTGTINGFAYAADCDSPQLLENLSGFSVYNHVYLV